MGIYLVLAICMAVATWIGYQLGRETAAKEAAPRPIPRWPLTQVVFDPETTDEERLRFLDEVAQAIQSGLVRSSKRVADGEVSQ